MSKFVPVIDLAAAGRSADELTRLIDHTCRASGFFVVVGHGVEASVTAAAYAQLRAFFEQHEAMKLRVAADLDDPLLRGYVPGQRQQQYFINRLGELGPDAPVFQGSSALAGSNRWPASSAFRDACLDYYDALSDFSMRLMRLMARSLDLSADWFDDKFKDHMSPLAANYYPPQPVSPEPGSLRTARHRDWGVVTVLYQDDAPGGLQVLLPCGEWLDVPALANSFVINLGRLMTRWTNGRWASTIHRVVNPGPEDAHRDRLSMAYFYHPSPATAIVPMSTRRSGEPGGDVILAGPYHVAMARRARERSRIPAQHA
jgi:isopenicillin N synthase-like dioxygenase